MSYTVKAKAFRVTETSREILQNFIVEQIPEDTKFVLASSEGYLFFSEEIPMVIDHEETFRFRIPKLAVLSYYDVDYEMD
jgi:hypothetical protein